MNRIALGFALALTAASASSAFAAADVYRLTLKNHKFSPEGVTIPAGKKVKFAVKNLGATPAEFESGDFKAEKVIPAGKEVELYVGPLTHGSYEFHDEYHEAQSESSVAGKMLHTLVGYTACPAGTQIAAYLATLAVIVGLARFVGRPQPAARQAA